MNKRASGSKRQKNNSQTSVSLAETIPSAVKNLLASCDSDVCFDHVDAAPIPYHEAVVQIIQQARRILFPGYFTQTRLDRVSLEYYLGQQMTQLFDSLSKQIVLSMQHGCLRFDQPCQQCTERGNKTALQFIQSLPPLRAVLAKDIRAALDGDPAAKSFEDIIFSYPGLLAITVYRMAHVLYELEVPLLPRIMTEYAHGLAGIDIHPGARIGESFFIDHGTGVVVGETTEIGDRVRIYQGVTLGALSLPRDAVDQYRNKKRHPTIEDDVIIYSNATILGEKAIIGARSIIGGNVWITDSVPPDTKVLMNVPGLVYIGNGTRSTASKDPLS